jgi:anaerobic magnesium-protoporphyrin IX monomethyl ester cyclase
MRPRALLFNLPPLGGDLFPVSLGYIAASLAARGIDSTICEIDADTSLTEADICRFILDYGPTVVGMATYQINVRMAVRLARLVKTCDPGIVVAFGGPQATFMPTQALTAMPAVDVIVRGEGEAVLPDVVDCSARGDDLAAVQGIAYRDATGLHETPPRALVHDLDALPSPYQTGVFRWRDHSGVAMLTSRGCSWPCGFCYTPAAFARRIRAHSVRRVLADMDAAVRHYKRRFFFADPSFTFDRRRTKAIMQGILRRRWKVQIWCETRADLVDAQVLELMARAGVRSIAYGLESADPAVTTLLEKKLELRRFADAITMTRAAGIEPEVFTLYGLPGQTRASALDTLRFVQDLGVRVEGNSSGQQLHLFFGTRVHDDPERYGIRLLPRRRPAYVSAGTDFETEHMTKRDMAFVARKYRQAATARTAGPPSYPLF